tara:strand:- start:46 stop:405 length:360 start_codon:yes stop_codon:yes gene_type:complete
MQFKGLNKKFKSIILSDGDILFSQGDKTGDGYIIQYGNIQLKTSEKMVSKLPVIGPGEIFGVWKVLFENEERFFTATAIINTSLLVIPAKFLEKELDTMDPFLRHCFKAWIPLSEHFSV